MVLRSFLFVPGNRPERFAKACSSGADAVIIDLEDAVPPEEKSAARAHVASWLSGNNPVYVRVNGTDTEWFEDDLSVLLRPGVTGVVLPKAGTHDDVAQLASRLPPGVRIIPLVETALGVWNSLLLASAPKVERLAFGSIDLQLDAGITGEGEELLYARSRVVLASRVAGILPPLDGVTTAVDAPDLLAADVQRARRLGFSGKLCIHPNQIPVVNAGFLPTPQEVEWAHTIMEAVGSMGEGAISLNGKMVDRPVIDKARKILEAVPAIRN
jgi:citrate lyase subunit beta/citryl-CoA lyase